MRLYKGASAGTHWFNNDPRQSGFRASAGPKNWSSVVKHITSYSHPSPFLSFSASPAIARGYALPVGAQLGRIYEIDTSIVPAHLVDPVQEIATAFGPLSRFGGPLWATHHDGDASLLEGLANGTVPPVAAVPHLKNTMRTPSVTPHFQAVVFALRDAEVLIFGALAASCVVDAWDVP